MLYMLYMLYVFIFTHGNKNISSRWVITFFYELEIYKTRAFSIYGKSQLAPCGL